MNIKIYVYNFEGLFLSKELLIKLIEFTDFIRIERQNETLEIVDYEIICKKFTCVLYKGGNIIEFEGQVLQILSAVELLSKNINYISNLYCNTHGAIVPSMEYMIYFPVSKERLALHIDKINKYDLVSKLLEKSTQ